MSLKIIKYLLSGYLLFHHGFGFAQIDSLQHELTQTSNDKSPIYLELARKMIKASPDSVLPYLNLANHFAIKENNDDVLILVMKEKAEEFSYLGQLDSSRYYFQLLAKQLPKLSLSPEVKMKIYFKLGNYYGNEFEMAKSFLYLDSTMSFALSINDSLIYADALNKKGGNYDNMGKRTEALKLYLQAMDIYESQDDFEMYSKTINNIGIIYKKLNDFKNALFFYNKSISLNMESGDAEGVAIARLNRGMLKKDMKKFSDALSDLHFSLGTFKNLTINYGVAVAKHNLGEIHLAAGAIDSANYYLTQSQKTAQSFGYVQLIVKNDLALAKLFHKENKHKTSLKYALSAYEKAREQEQLEDLRDLSELLYKNYESLQSYQLALKYHKEFKTITDSIFDQSSRKDLNLLRTTYDVEMKDKEIKSLADENALQSSLAMERKKLNYALGGGVSVALVLALVLFVLYQRKRKLSKSLIQQKSLLISKNQEIEEAQDRIVQQNESLIKLNAEKDNIMAMVAHDLRSPLNQIKGVLGLIKMTQGKEDSDQFIDIASQSADVLNKRINRILDIEAINAGKVNLQVENIEVEGILKILEKNTFENAQKKNIKIKLEVEKGLSCLADENYLIQVLENLCTNAIKFSPSNSEVTLVAKSIDRGVLLAVKDQGPGIPDKEKPLLFTKFAKISNKPTGDEKSTGLGLSIVKKYVEAMEGEVWCESQLNQGSSFNVKLPFAQLG